MSKISGIISNLSKHRTHNLRMPAFTLYGSRGSTNTARVLLTLAEGGFTDYELQFVDLQKGEQKVRVEMSHVVDRPLTFPLQSTEHLKLNPWGKIPSITCPDGFTLYESRAICQYLASKYSFPLLPKADAESTALFNQAQLEEILYFADPAGKIGFEKFVKKFRNLPVDEAVIASSLQSLEAFFAVADRQLQSRDYMAGDEFTLVDIYYIPLIERLFVCGYKDVVVSHEAVAAWWNRCVERPAIKKHLAAEQAAMAAARK
jgi:glutathione S-transferase